MLGNLRFGTFTLDPRAKLLFRDGEPIPLGARTTALLEALVAAAGAPVTKADLMERAWPGLAVEEGNLSVQIATLRKALGTRDDGAEWIRTVPRVGYRLLSPGLALSGDPLSTIPALAVLPFQNLSGDPGEDYLADGIVEDLTTALSRFHSFAVVARNSAFVYKGRAVDVREVAKDLGVLYVLQGSVRRGGGQLRITGQLLDGQTGMHLWAESFDGHDEDVFSMQDGIVESVVGVVAPEIVRAEIERSRRKAPESLAAYDLYLQAIPKVYEAVPASNAEAQALLERAIALDPNYAMALIMAAWVLEHRISMGWPLSLNDRERMIGYADRALTAAPSDALVMGMASEILFVAKHHDRALALASRAVAMNPNHIFVLTFAGIVFTHLGDLDEALRCFERAVRLSPNDPFGHGALTCLAEVHLIRGDYERAIVWAERSLAVNGKFGATYWFLIASNAHLGRIDEARRSLQAYRATAPEVTLASLRAAKSDRPFPERSAVTLDGLRLAGMPEV